MFFGHWAPVRCPSPMHGARCPVYGVPHVARCTVLGAQGTVFSFPAFLVFFKVFSSRFLFGVSCFCDYVLFSGLRFFLRFLFSCPLIVFLVSGHVVVSRVCVFVFVACSRFCCVCILVLLVVVSCCCVFMLCSFCLFSFFGFRFWILVSNSFRHFLVSVYSSRFLS